MERKNWDWRTNEKEPMLKPSKIMAYLTERWDNFGYQNILDIGAGMGRNSIYLAKRGFNVTALDNNKFALDYTKKYANEQSVTVLVKDGNAMKLPYNDESFDGIIACNLIFNNKMGEVKKIISEIGRILKPYGEAYITLQGKKSLGYLNARGSQLVDKCTIKNENGIPEFYVDAKDIFELFSDFQIVDSLTEKLMYDLKNPESYTSHYAIFIRKQKNSQN